MSKGNIRIIHWKSFIVVFLLVLLVLVSLLLFLNTRLKTQALEESRNKAQLVSSEAVHTIEMYFRDAYTINRLFAESFIQYKKNKISRYKVYNLMKGAIQENSNFLAIWTMWEPNAYDGMDKVFAGDSLHDPKGSFAIAYYFDNHILKSEINDTLDYLEDFYTIPAGIKKPIILEPFYYQYHGNEKEYFETSLASPIIENGLFLGVIGIDIDLHALQDKFDTLKVYKDGFVSILSNAGHIVTGYHSLERNYDSAGFQYIEDKSIVDSFKTGRVFVYKGISEFSKTKVLRFFYPINIEYMVAPWYIMVEIPEQEIYQTVRSIKITIGVVLFLILLIGILAMNYMLNRRRQQSLNRILFQDSRTPLVVMDPENSQFIDCNPAAVKIYGYTIKKELLGKTPFDVLAPEQENGDTKMSVNQFIKTALEKESVLCECINSRPDGTIWFAEVHLMAFNFWGKKLLQFNIMDITDRRKAYHELLRYQNQLELMVKERTDELQTVNEELQSTNEDLYEKNEILFQQKEQLSQTLETLKNTQSQLIQAEKMASLGVLTAGVAHEINNPLNFIMGSLVGFENYFAKHKPEDEQKIEVLLRGMKTGVERATSIVKGLNQFSRDTDSYSEEYEIRTIVENCLIILQNQIKDRIEIQKDYFSETIVMKGSVGKLHQVVINLLTNSIQAIEGKGTIWLKTQQDTKNITLIVSDTGCGISAEILPKITDPFFTTKAPNEGVGLGLSISYSIVKDHRGSLTFESEPGKGTKVMLTLPR